MFYNTNKKFFTQYVYGVFGTIFLDIPTFLSLSFSVETDEPFMTSAISISYSNISIE
jgi:hypothetical protein